MLHALQIPIVIQVTCARHAMQTASIVQVHQHLAYHVIRRPSFKHLSVCLACPLVLLASMALLAGHVIRRATFKHLSVFLACPLVLLAMMVLLAGHAKQMLLKNTSTS